MNVKEKQYRINLISNLIMENTFGVLDNSKYINFNIQDVNIIKKTLFNKSKISKGYDKEFFYKVSIKLNMNNYENMFKLLDNHFKKNTIVKDSKNLDYDSDIEIDERKTKVVTITSQSLPNYIKNNLKNYVYVVDSTLNLIRIYFRNKTEYINNIESIKNIKESLDKLNLNLKIHFLSESHIIKNMSILEKKEFDNFLDTY